MLSEPKRPVAVMMPEEPLVRPWTDADWAMLATADCGQLFCQATVAAIARVIGQARAAERERILNMVQSAHNDAKAALTQLGMADYCEAFALGVISGCRRITNSVRALE